MEFEKVDYECLQSKIKKLFLILLTKKISVKIFLDKKDFAPKRSKKLKDSQIKIQLIEAFWSEILTYEQGHVSCTAANRHSGKAG